MKKKFQMNPLVLLAAAAVLLVASTVGSTQAALTYYSENYAAEVTVSDIGVSLLENGTAVSYRNYLGDDKWDVKKGELLKDLTGGEKLVLGKAYKEELSVRNTGTIDTYVRVILTKSWQTPEGVKNETLSPDLIDLHLLTGNGWIEDPGASTAERTVLYYTRILPEDAGTPNLSDTLKIDPSIGTKMIRTETINANGKTIVYTYEYDGYQFIIEAEVDAVQTHNAADAIKSAWGVNVRVAADGSLSLN